MNACYLVGAGAPCLRGFAPTKEDLLIAVDGGLHLLNRIGVTPQIFLGDMDSFGKLPKNLPSQLEVIRHPVAKDDTDMGLALSVAFDRGYRDFRIFGGGGGRIDHLMANLQNMAAISKKGASVRLIDTHQDLYVITNETLTLPLLPEGTTVSIFSHDKKSTGVTLSGLLYPLQDGVLSNNHPLGVSNATASSSTCAVITVRSGTLSVWVERGDGGTGDVWGAAPSPA